MKQANKNGAVLALSVGVVSLLAGGTALAERGNGQGGTEQRVSTMAATEEPASTTSTGNDAVTTKPDELRNRADKMLESRRADQERRKTAKTSVEGRQKACQARETNLKRKITNFDKQSQRHLDRYNATLVKLQAYQETNKLDAPDYDTLVAAAEAKKTAATAAVVALKQASVDVDCTKDDPAAAVATVKESVTNTREALKQYHKAVKALLVELNTSKSDGGTN